MTRDGGRGGGSIAGVHLDQRAAARQEFAAFLRARRERLDPQELGLPVVGLRRTPGLRREELAQLAGVSVDYYIRLEQGRDLRPSAAVLEGIARALRLGPDERQHLFRLGRAEPPQRRTPAGVERVRPGVRRMLEVLGPSPALVLGRRLDVLAWNRAAAALMTDFAAVPPGRRNIVWLLFLDEGVRGLYAEWDVVARDTVACLRAAAGRFPDDPGVAALVGELSVKSDQFRQWWARQDVTEKTRGHKAFAHPLVGRIGLDYEAMAANSPVRSPSFLGGLTGEVSATRAGRRH